MIKSRLIPAHRIFAAVVKFRGGIMSGTRSACITFALCRLISLRAHRGTNYPSRIDFRLRSISIVKYNDRLKRNTNNILEGEEEWYRFIRNRVQAQASTFIFI